MKIKDMANLEIKTGYAIVTKKGNKPPYNNSFPCGIHFYESRKSATDEIENHNGVFREQWKVIDAILLLKV